MSFLACVEKVGASHYVLPRVGAMRTEVHAFLSEALFAQTEEALWAQAAASASVPGATGMYLMPDTHLGYHLPVGGVLVTDDVILQAGSGYDISCFTGDTRVSLVDGREMTFHELVEAYGDGGEFYVYSVTPEGRVTSGRAHHPRKTRACAPLIEVTLDNGQTVRCTPDHQWMNREGRYVRASELRPGDSLMPLYRSYEGGYCNVRHPADGQTERMYRAAFRERHGYVPEWPRVIHHDIFNPENHRPATTNDDPRFLVEMDEKEHIKLHSSHARERGLKGESGWKRLHVLKPEQMSRMASENMTRLHQDPAFQARARARMSATNKKCREAGLYAENWSGAGARGKETLESYNQSEKGRETSRLNRLKNRGRVCTIETRQKLVDGHARSAAQLLRCPHCDRVCRGPGGLARHIHWSHNNHRVVSIRELSETADVYCLTVDTYANFALSAGVFVHNCGVVYLEVPGLSAADVADPVRRKRWIDAVERRVATGVGSERPRLMPKFSSRDMEDVLRHGAKAVGVSADLCERQYIPVPDEVDLHAIPRAREKAAPQMGSVGGGNHFVEMQVDRDDGSVWVMIHCGSRGFGWQAANHFFYEGSRLRGLPSNRREESWLRADEELGKLYWAWHNAAANFAVANRWTIVEGIQQALGEVYAAKAKPYYEISHNLVQQETLVLPDGSTKRGFVHRKGATRAFPAGHPELRKTRWAETGHPCLIPGSMLDGAAILFPLEGAYRSGCSVNHGSGRLMARGEAKRELAAIHDDIDREMKEITREFNGVKVTGIVGNTERTPLDECGHVYKNLDAVLAVLEDEGIARVARRLYPVANIKGTD